MTISLDGGIRPTKQRDHNKPRPIYLLRLQPIHGDGVHALRRLLKYSGRYLGLKAISVTEEKSERVML
jgi:hypothetical protein